MYRLACIVFLFSFAAAAAVKEVPTIREATATVDAETLLVFDFDNTVIMPAQTLGGEEWFDYLAHKYVKELIEPGETEETAVPKAIGKALREWNAVQEVTDVLPVEKDGPAVIREKQNGGTAVMGLTARPKALMAVTQKQFKAIDVDFARKAPHPKALDLKSKGPARYQDGVLYVGPVNNKGVVLKMFLAKTGLKPKKLVFVDNKSHHLESVQAELEGSGIEYLGCRLAAADAKIAAFDSAIADLQHRYFRKILDDKAAKTLLLLKGQ